MQVEMFHGYTVYSDGTVIKPWGGRVNWTPNGRGYLISQLKVDGKFKCLAQHRVVALAFFGERDSRHEVDHIDNDKTNNRVENLQWVTRSANRTKMYSQGRNVSGTRNANSKLGEQQVHQVCEALSLGGGVSDVARKIGVPRHTVSQIKCRRQWLSVSKNYTW